MTTHPTSPDRFEERLLAQLQDVVAQNSAPSAVPARSRPRARRTRLALSGAGVAAVGTAAVILATGGDVATPAYAVQARQNGTVSVKINDLRDARGLQRKLRAAGIPAVVKYVANPGKCRAPQALPGGGAIRRAPGQGELGGLSRGPAIARGRSLHKSGSPPAGGERVKMSARVSSSGSAVFTLDPGDIKPGEKLTIAATTGSLSSLAMVIGKGSKGLPPLPCPPPIAP